MKKTLSLIAAVLTIPCSALLPPLYESLAEFKMLIDDKRLSESLDSSEAIMNIKKSDDMFVITTNKRSINVRIIHDPTHLVGPGKYHLEFLSK